MTVTHTQTFTFPQPVDSVRSTVEAITRDHVSWEVVRKNKRGFELRFSPRTPFVLPTNVHLALEPRDQGTRAIATTRSQWFILGDIFGAYPRLLADLERLLRAGCSVA
jgi:hypothetical protein